MKTSLFLLKWSPRQAAQVPQDHQPGTLSKPPAFSSLIIQLPADTPAFTQQNLAYTLQLHGYQAFEPEENLQLDSPTQGPALTYAVLSSLLIKAYFKPGPDDSLNLHTNRGQEDVFFGRDWTCAMNILSAS